MNLIKTVSFLLLAGALGTAQANQPAAPAAPAPRQEREDERKTRPEGKPQARDRENLR